MIFYNASRNPPLKPNEFRIINDDFLGLGIVGSFTVKGRMTVAAIQVEVADYFDVPVFEIKSSRRCKSSVRARHVAMYLARELTPKSLPEIGRMFGDRDHTTVIHAIRRIKELSATDPKLAEAIQNLLAILSPEKAKTVDRTLRNNQENGKEHSGNTQEERLAA